MKAAMARRMRRIPTLRPTARPIVSVLDDGLGEEARGVVEEALDGGEMATMSSLRL
jgi:hypothetical protein